MQIDGQTAILSIIYIYIGLPLISEISDFFEYLIIVWVVFRIVFLIITMAGPGRIINDFAFDYMWISKS